MVEITKASAALRVSSRKLTAAEITGRLGIAPSRQAEKGESISKKSATPTFRDNSLWLLDSGLPSSATLDAHLEKVSGLVELHARSLRALLEDCNVDVFCGFTFHSDQGGFMLSPGVVKRLSSVPVEVVFALYHWEEDQNYGDAALN
jgi:hypothetical protein